MRKGMLRRTRKSSRRLDRASIAEMLKDAMNNFRANFRAEKALNYRFRKPGRV